MPVYEFYCQKCQNDCELLVRGEETPLCPRCGSKKLKRQMSAPASHSSGSQRRSGCGADPNSCGMQSRHGGGCCGGCCHH
ncbi:MAG: zinc ribbon domain-containing protein [Planctomycetaceae bacterium]|nr:zinc ribbon domain-containing protein [Planctomycetaceae bacterium]